MKMTCGSRSLAANFGEVLLLGDRRVNAGETIEGQLTLAACNGIHQHRLSIPNRRHRGHAVIVREYGYAIEAVATAVKAVLASGVELCTVELDAAGDLVFAYATGYGKERTHRVAPLDETSYHCDFLNDLREDYERSFQGEAFEEDDVPTARLSRPVREEAVEVTASWEATVR